MKHFRFLERDFTTSITEKARQLVVSWQHGEMGIEHLFVAILTTRCVASPYVAEFNSEEWVAKTKERFSPDESVINCINYNAVPLTSEAEGLLKQACLICEKLEQEVVHSVHILLAMLSYENKIRAAFNSKGILFEDICERHFNKTLPPLAWKIKPFTIDSVSTLTDFFSADIREPDSINKLYSNAYTLMIYGQLDDCIQVSKNGLALMPEDERLKQLLLNVYFKKHDFSAALIIVLEMQRAKPESDNTRLLLSYCYGGLGRYEEAAELLDQLSVALPNNGTIWNSKGFNLLQQGKYAEALPALEKAIQLNPESAFSYNNLGFVKHKLGKTEEGLVLIDRSLQMDKGNSFAYKNKGIIYKDLHQKEEALKNFQLALKYGYTEKYGGEVVNLVSQMG